MNILRTAKNSTVATVAANANKLSIVAVVVGAGWKWI